MTNVGRIDDLSVREKFGKHEKAARIAQQTFFSSAFPLSHGSLPARRVEKVSLQIRLAREIQG